MLKLLHRLNDVAFRRSFYFEGKMTFREKVHEKIHFLLSFLVIRCGKMN